MARKKRHIRWDRVFLVFGPLLLIILLLCKCCGSGNASDDSSLIIRSTGTGPVMPLQTTADDSHAVPVLNPEVHEYTIVLDPGHGGNDDGAVNADKTRKEKDDNLRLSLAVREALLKHPHVRVLMTRETDVFVELEERCQFANSSDADFFVSLHRNSATEGEGVEIWVNNSAKDNAMDKLLGGYIKEHLDTVGVSNSRGVKEGFRGSSRETVGNNYYVNRNTNMPSCLVEMGFMNSAKDNMLFDERLEQYAEAIANALIEIGEDKNLYSASAQ